MGARSSPPISSDLTAAARFDSTLNFTREPTQKLHLVLTNPTEFPAALDQPWQAAEEIRDAPRRGDFEVLHLDEIGQEASRLLSVVIGSPAWERRRKCPQFAR
jgi:hypothetical protein